MKQFTFVLIIPFVLALFFAGCGEDTSVTPKLSETADEVSSLAKGAGGTVETSNIYSRATGEVVGTAALQRGYNDVYVKIKTSDLEPGDAVTVWWVFFNYPENCEIPYECAAVDLFNPDVAADLNYATGAIVRPDGTIRYRARRKAGDDSGSAMPYFNELLGVDIPAVGILDPQKAEIHFVLRSHGPAIDEYMPEMIESFNAGCTYPENVTPGIVGTPGPNTCEDQQSAVFRL